MSASVVVSTTPEITISAPAAPVVVAHPITAPSTLISFTVSDRVHVSFTLTIDFASAPRFFSSLLGLDLFYICQPKINIRRPDSSSYTFSWMSSSFLASSNSFGTPCGLFCALRHSFHNSLQKAGVSFSRKPVSWICSFLISGWNKC